MNKLIRAEWIKFRSLRSNWVLLIAAAVIDIALLVIGLMFFNRTIGSGSPVTDAAARIGTITSPLTSLAMVLGVLAVMVMGSEYKSKTVVPSFAAAPIRAEVVAAKAILVALVSFGTAVALMAVNVVAGMVSLDAQGFPVDVADDHFVQAVGGAVLYVGLAALFGFGLGLLFKSSVLSITLVVAIPSIVEPALAGFLPDWADRFLPFTAGHALTSPAGTDRLSAWEGGGVLGLWAVVIIIGAALVFERRDLGSTS